MIITKTDFLLYQEAPLHLWALKHNQLNIELSQYELHLMEQGKDIGELGKEFLSNFVSSQGIDAKIDLEKTFIDVHFQARVDAIVLDPNEEVYDIYEIKSSTSVKKEHKYDVTFQWLVCEASIPVRKVFIIHINKEYVRNGEIDFNQFFIVTDVTEDVEKLLSEVALERNNAWNVAISFTLIGIESCLKPKVCPCPNLCHPDLPEFPIYDLTRLHQNKARLLRSQGILAIADIPDNSSLSERQMEQVYVVKEGKPFIDYEGIKRELQELEYPLYFLDYETYSPGIPFFDGYRPYQHIVFQYSLHAIRSPGAEPDHYEYLDTSEGDPCIRVIQHLVKNIGQAGSVIVWNQSFEAGRNKEMAERYPAYRDVLLNINERMYDLMEIFSKGYYIHPDFHGSSSIKNVLPVLVRDLSEEYDEMIISQGDEAMMAWANIMSGIIPQGQVEQTRNDLLRYCELDSVAMVRIWEALLVL